MIKMTVSIGSLNRGKVLALENALESYPDLFGTPDVVAVDVDSGVRKQPFSLDEIFTGAKNRALRSYESDKFLYGFGIESGVFKSPQTQTGYLDTTACAIYDGKTFHVGTSSCFEYPPEMIRLIEEGLEVSEAAVELGYAKDMSFKEGGGMVEFLSGGRLSRVSYSEESVHMAMFPLLNPGLYL